MQWFIDVSKEAIEEALKILQIQPKVLAHRSNTMWDVLLANEGQAKNLAGSILTRKSVCLQTEYMGTQKTTFTLLSMPMDVMEEWLQSFSSALVKYRMCLPSTARRALQLLSLFCKSQCLASSSMTSQIFGHVMVRTSLSLWKAVVLTAGSVGHLAKMCSQKNLAPHHHHQQ